jgi:ferredoxin
LYEVIIDTKTCDGCEEKSDPYQASECAFCLSCVETCPNSAITVKEL